MAGQSPCVNKAGAGEEEAGLQAQQVLRVHTRKSSSKGRVTFADALPLKKQASAPEGTGMESALFVPNSRQAKLQLAMNRPTLAAYASPEHDLPRTEAVDDGTGPINRESPVATQSAASRPRGVSYCKFGCGCKGRFDVVQAHERTCALQRQRVGSYPAGMKGLPTVFESL